MTRSAVFAVVASVAMLAMVLSVDAARADAAGAPASTVYVTNLEQNSVTAINTSTHSVSIIKGSMNGPLGIAITPNGETAYVTNSLGDTVTPIDLATHPASVGSRITVGNGPAAIAIAPDGATAYVSDFNANTVTPLDLRSGGAGAPITVGAGPWSIAVSPDGRTVCVANSEGTTVSVIDTATRAVTTVSVGARPGAIAMAPNGLTAYVADGNQVTPIDLRNDAAMAPIAVGNGPVGIAIAPDGAQAYTANTDNTVTPIDLRTSPARPGTPVPVATLSQPDGITVSPDGSTAYAANASNTVTPINLRTSPITPEAPIQVGTATFGIAVAPDQAPIARFSAKPALAGRSTRFNASASSAPDGKIVKYSWSFGDGTGATTSSASTTHVYAKSGSYHATLVETSLEGTSLSRTFTGQTMSNNGGRAAEASATVHVPTALQSSPSSGPPGVAVTLRDTNFTSSCRPVYVFFDNKLIAQVSPAGQTLDDKQLVIPGDATLGGHRLELSCTTARPYLLSAYFDVVATQNHLSEFSVAMPSPGELASHLAASGGISLLLLLLSRLLAAGFPSEWLDSTYEANRERFHERARKHFPRLFLDREVPKSTRRRFIGGTGIFLGFLVIAGTINSVLDPSFGLNRTTLWLFLGQCVGVGVVTLTTQLPIIVGGLREHRMIHLQVLIGGLIIAIVCVAGSRAVGLSPGYCYGLIAVFMLRPHVEEHEWGKLHAIASVCILAVASAAFFLTVPVFHQATAVNPSPFWLILDPALNVVFLGGFASVAFGMFPLPFLPGRYVARWSRPAWLVITITGLIGFVAVLLTPGSGSQRELHHVALIPLVVAFLVFAVFSLSVMLYFHFHPMEPEQHHHEEPTAVEG